MNVIDQCLHCYLLAHVAATAERHAIKTSHQNFSESTQAIAPLTEEEKQAKLAELKAKLAEKRAAKAREEAEERRQSEKIRRKTGQEISVARQQMEEKEMKKAMEAKRKEKEADRLAKAKIKAQIEQDKKERQAKVIWVDGMLYVMVSHPLYSVKQQNWQPRNKKSNKQQQQQLLQQQRRNIMTLDCR